MSVIPANFAIRILQGSTFDETFILYLPRASPSDPLVPMAMAGWTARMKLKKNFDGTALVSLVTGGAAPPAADGIVLGAADGTIRIYIRAATTAALTHAQWTRGATPGATYIGVWDLELVNPAGEVFREIGGQVVFSREVTT